MRQEKAECPVATLPADVQIRSSTDGTIKSLKAADLSASLERDRIFRELMRGGRWAEASVYFLCSLGARLRLNDAESELAAKSVERDDAGFHHVRLTQLYAGLPVWGGEIIVHWNPQNAIYLVEGDYLPTPSGLSPKPRLDASTAVKKAEKAAAVPCSGCIPELGIFRRVGGGAGLAYRMHLPQGISQVWEVVVDAGNGDILEQRLVPR